MDRAEMTRKAVLFFLTLALSFSGCTTVSKEKCGMPGFVYGPGTQTFSPTYRFTRETKLVETARAISGMGSNVLKIVVSSSAQNDYGIPVNPEIRSIKDILLFDPSYRTVFEMPFDYYLIWAYPFATKKFFAESWTEEERQREYREMYDLTRYLLKIYDGTGKTFLLGHWEGDWMLLAGYDMNADPSPEAARRMADWLNLRQKAVDDAKRETPHRGVHVLHYTEVNLVQKAIQGRRTVCNDVLPETNIDLVSYSSYDSLDLSKGSSAMRDRLKSALDYIQSKLPEKQVDWNMPRVFIGEYGFPLHVTATGKAQADASREVIRAGLEWNCPFILYWEIYNNEILKDGSQAGFWMIDDKNQPQPAFFMHKRFLRKAREWTKDYVKKHREQPPYAEYCRAALGWLADPAGE